MPALKELRWFIVLILSLGDGLPRGHRVTESLKFSSGHLKNLTMSVKKIGKRLVKGRDDGRL